MPGKWIAMPTICSSRRTGAYQSCNQWADEGSWQCSQWADHGSSQCSQWKDEGYSACSQWADDGYNACCDWWPCSWACDALVWISNVVCHAWYWVANLVCQAWYWVANLVCQAWFWVARWVCLLWVTIFYVFCLAGNGGPAFLLTDGSILLNECASGYGTRKWWRLSPDSKGDYTRGTWIRVHDSINARKYFASAVLADGRFVVAGGEYSDVSGSSSQDETNKCEIYDPVADFWTAIASPPLTQVGDSACCMLANGKLLLGDLNSPKTFTLDPATLTWSAAGGGGQKNVRASEESWAMMADGTVVTPECVNAPNAEKYLPATDQWVTAGQLTADIVESSSSEIGAGVLLPDGRAFFVGANSGRTALYTSGNTPAAAGTWSAGPTIPATRSGQARGAKDGPAALEPGGKVLFPAAPLDGVSGNYLSPCTFYEFDGASLATVTNVPNSSCPTYVGRLLVIPSGEILWSREDHRHMYLFRSSDAPQNSWRPVINSIPPFLGRGTTVTISGTQFNGLSHASAYGDDHTPATNYPIVRVRNNQTGRVQYCRTANHSTMGVATGATIVSTQVTIALAADPGPSTLFVVANGIESEGVSVTIM